MLKTARFFFHLLKTSMRSSISKRGAFLIESAMMIINNLIFLTLWWVFFRQFDKIVGWNMDDMIALIAIGSGAYGLNQICFGGVKYLSKMIMSGDLDSFMTQPKNILLHACGSKSLSKGWGNLMTALVLTVLGSFTAPSTILLILTGILCGCLVFTSFGIIAHSLPFWLGSMESVSKKYCDALYLFALYPTNIYTGYLQIIMFTIIPAGIIGYIPVELLRDFSWLKLAWLVGSSFTFLGAAFLTFFSGLRRYESGNQFGMRL